MPYDALSPTMLAPVVIVVFTTWLASWRGSRRIATGLTDRGARRRHPTGGRSPAPARPAALFSLAVLVVGTATMAFGVSLPRIVPLTGPDATEVMAFAIAVAFVGELLSFTGVLMCTRFFVPGVLDAVGRLLGRSARPAWPRRTRSGTPPSARA